MDNIEKVKDVRKARLGSDVLDYLIEYGICQVISVIILGVLVFVTGSFTLGITSDNESIESIFNSPLIVITTLSSFISTILFEFVYFTVIPCFTKGVTLGKLAAKVKIVKSDYSNCTFKNLLLRNVRMFLTIITFIPSVLQMLQLISAGIYIVLTIITGLINYLFYIIIIVQIARGSVPFHDRFAHTIVIHKNYDPTMENYESATLINSWADVEGIKIDNKNNAENDDENKESNYWND